MQGWAPGPPQAEAAQLILLTAEYERDEWGRGDLPAPRASQGGRALQLPRTTVLLLLHKELCSLQDLTVGYGYRRPLLPSPQPALILWPHVCPQLPMGIVA